MRCGSTPRRRPAGASASRCAASSASPCCRCAAATGRPGTARSTPTCRTSTSRGSAAMWRSTPGSAKATARCALWADVDDGKLIGGAADLALTRVDASLGKGLEPLVLRAVTGRLAGRMTDETLEFSTTDLQFDTADGMRWPGGNLWFQHTPAQGPHARARRLARRPARPRGAGADRRSPAARRGHAQAHRRRCAPRGLVERIDASWQGSLGAPDKYQARGRVSGFGIASQPGAAAARRDRRMPRGDAAAGPGRRARRARRHHRLRRHPGRRQRHAVDRATARSICRACSRSR